MPAEPPNALWICTDQQRYDTLGCYGNGIVDTPHIDGLADRITGRVKFILAREAPC